MPAGRKQVRLVRKAEVNCRSIDRTGATTAYVLIAIGRVYEIATGPRHFLEKSDSAPHIVKHMH